MRTCKDCFWFNAEDKECHHKLATIPDYTGTGQTLYLSAQEFRTYAGAKFCESQGKFWLDAAISVCPICDQPILPSQAEAGEDEPMHLDCAVGRAESRAEGDR